MMKLVEEPAGLGDLMHNGQVLGKVRYKLQRYQGCDPNSALPIPGLFRIDGFLEPERDEGSPGPLDVALALRLEDGRVLAITIVDSNGRVLSEGHGPTRCLCC